MTQKEAPQKLWLKIRQKLKSTEFATIFKKKKKGFLKNIDLIRKSIINKNWLFWKKMFLA